MEKESYFGVAEDSRSEFEKAQDISDREIASGASDIRWEKKDPSAWKRYSVRNQDGSYSCVAQAIAKFLEIAKGEVQSAHPIYRSRINFPGQGMIPADAGNIAISQGTVREDQDPSQNLNEADMNRVIAPNISPLPNDFIKVMMNPVDIERVASAVQAYGHCLLLVRGSVSEWSGKPVYDPMAKRDLDHEVCAVDYFLDESGAKCILIDDSWGNATTIGNGGQRVITEDYFKARFTEGMYFIPKEKPHHLFSNILAFGMMHDKDVMALQDILKFEGFFPKEIPSSGNFLQVTARSVKDWQLYHGLTDFQHENDLRKIRCGAKSLAILNALYN